jgi:hypothetical protein
MLLTMTGAAPQPTPRRVLSKLDEREVVFAIETLRADASAKAPPPAATC